MPDSLCIVVCDNIFQETISAIKAEGFDDVIVKSYQSNCGYLPLPKEDLFKTVQECAKKYEDVRLIGSCCLSAAEDLISTVKSCLFYKPDQCFELFLNKDIIADYNRQGAYLLSPGWLQRWEDHLEKWGFDRVMAQSFFKESLKKIILIDTGINKKSLIHLKEFAEYIDLPYSAIQAGLDHYRLFLKGIVLEWRLEKSRVRAEKSLMHASRQLSEYVMVSDLIGSLATAALENDIIEKILGIFRMLFAPNRLLYIKVENRKTGLVYPDSFLSDEENKIIRELLEDFHKAYYKSLSGRGYFIRISHMNETLGIIEAAEFTFPEYEEHYLNLSLTIANVCSVVISNVRRYQMLTQERDKFRTYINIAGVILVAIDTKQKITFINRKGCEVLGYREDEIIGKNWFDNFLPENIRDDIKTAFQGLIGGKFAPVEYYENPVLTRSGEERIIAWHNTLLRDDTGAITGSLSSGRDITELMKNEEKLKASVKEKETLIKEIHHRVKNNLQIISSMLKLQAAYITDDNILKLFKESQSRVDTMALIHEKLYQEKDLAKIIFSEYLDELVSNIFVSYSAQPERIKIYTDIADVFFDVNTAIPCGLIINEIVLNSLKHAFPEGRSGEIRIGLGDKGEGEYILTVSDNGVGFPEGLDFRNTDTLGLRLVNSLTRQLNGKIEMERNGGTTFRIIFKV